MAPEPSKIVPEFFVLHFRPVREDDLGTAIALRGSPSVPAEPGDALQQVPSRIEVERVPLPPEFQGSRDGWFVYQDRDYPQPAPRNRVDQWQFVLMPELAKMKRRADLSGQRRVDGIHQLDDFQVVAFPGDHRGEGEPRGAAAIPGEAVVSRFVDVDHEAAAHGFL